MIHGGANYLDCGRKRMKSLMHRLMFVGLAVVIAIPIAVAQEQKAKKKGGGGGPIGQLKRQLADAGLTEEQKKKSDAIIAEYEPKVAAATKKAGDAPKLVNDARKKLREEGKKGKELNDGAVAAAKLTPEQKEGYDELQRVTQDLRAAVAALLTDEQKQKAGLTKGKKKG
jgi:hypothetical protein